MVAVLPLGKHPFVELQGCQMVGLGGGRRGGVFYLFRFFL